MNNENNANVLFDNDFRFIELKKALRSSTPSELQLRQKAEQKLSESNREMFTESYMMKLVHELEVYQIELEMQNEELLMAKEKAELAEIRSKSFRFNWLEGLLIFERRET